MDGQASYEQAADGWLSCALFRRAPGFRQHHRDLHAARDAGRNFVLCRRTVHIVALETVRPDLQAVGSVDQLNVDAGPRSLAFDAAFDDVSHSKFVADGGDIHASVLIGERGLMRHDPEAPEPRKRIIEIFGQRERNISGCSIGAIAAGKRQQQNGNDPPVFDHRGATRDRPIRHRYRVRFFEPGPYPGEGEQQCQQADAGGTDGRCPARGCASVRGCQDRG